MELLGTMDNGVYRFDITMDMLDCENITAKENGQVIIPIKRPDDSFVYDDIFEMMSRHGDNSNYYQIPKLELIVHITGRFFFGGEIESDFESTYELIEIHPSKFEISVINQVLFLDFLKYKNNVS